MTKQYQAFIKEYPRFQGKLLTTNEELECQLKFAEFCVGYNAGVESQKPTELSDPQVRGHAVLDGGGYRDDETAQWEFTDAGLMDFAKVIRGVAAR